MYRLKNILLALLFLFFGVVFTYMSIGISYGLVTKNSKDAMFNDLIKIDIVGLFRNFVLSSLFFVSVLVVITMLLWVITFVLNRDVFPDLGFDIMLLFFKIFIVLDVVTTLAFSLDSNQFAIATSIVSFIALFSFILPKKLLKEIVEKISRIKKEYN